MFTAALFTITKTWKQPKCPSTDEWIKKVWCSPGWMHETSAQTWYTGKTQRFLVEREVGGGVGMGNTCKSMVDSCQCMTKTTTIL